MVFSIWKRVLIRTTALGQYALPTGRAYPVRQNAATTWHTHNKPFSSDQPDKTDSENRNKTEVVKLLKGHGFDDARISQLALLCTCIYRLKANENILPKLEFLKSIGISNTEIPKFVLRVPFLLSSSFEKQILPCYNYLKKILISDENLTQILKCRPGILLTKVDTVLDPNIKHLLETGVPVSSLPVFMLRCNSTLCRNHATFKIFVKQAIEMGINPLLKTFIQAVHVLCGISKETWEYKMKVYKRFGLTNDDIMSLFKKQPMIMAASEKNVMTTMKFLLDDMSLSREVIVGHPPMVLMSLEGRIAPRFRVIDMLEKKGLMKKIPTWSYLKVTEDVFLSKYVDNFVDHLPELRSVYTVGA